MNNRIPWNQYEAVLLVDACVKYHDGIITRDEAVKQLSKLLREYGKANGIDVDDVYRNTNGISMRMAEIERLFNNGKGGLKNTSKLFVDTVALYNNEKAQFNNVLEEAKRMTAINKSNKTSFLEWLKMQNKLKASPDRIVALLEEGSSYAVAHKVSQKSFWEMQDFKEFDAACRKLLGLHLFRVIHRSTALALDKCYVYYKNFLAEVALPSVERETAIEAKSKSAEEIKVSFKDAQNEINPNTKGVEEVAEQNVNEPAAIEVLNDTESLSDKLYLLLKSISDSNSYGTTSVYLASTLGTQEAVIKQVLNGAEWATLQYGRYMFNYSAIQSNMKYNFAKPQSLAYTKPISLIYFEDTTIEADTWRQLFIDFLKVIYEDYPHYINGIKGKIFRGASLPIIADKDDAVKMRAPKEFASGLFVETNRSASDIMATLKKILDSCYIDYENVVVAYEPKSNTDVVEQQAPSANKSSEKAKNITIVEAVSIVLQKADRPWTTSEIYNQIITDNLYTFGAQDPVHVVEVKINAACKGSGYSYRAPQELFGFIRDNGVKKYYLLTREKEMIKEQKASMPVSTSPDIRTGTDAKLAEKYPVLFKRIYSTMREYGNISVSAQDILDKVGKIARLSTVKRVLDYASWCEHIGSNYRYSAAPINYVLPEEQLETQTTILGENEFYHWLETAKTLSSADCSRYTSGINVISRFLKNECQMMVDVYTIQDSKIISGYFDVVEKHTSFTALANSQKERLSASMRLYIDYLMALEGSKNKEVSSAARLKEKEFRQWAALKVGPEKARSYADVLKFVEDRCIDNNLIEKPFYECDKDTDFNRLIECVDRKKFPFILQSANLNDAIGAIPAYWEFLRKDDISSKNATLPKNVKVLNFKDIGDLAFTKPVRLKYLDKESTEFSSWADLYAKLLFMMHVDHPRTLVDGTSLSGSSSPDISSKSQNMRAPKAIGKNLFVETNHDTKGLVNRMLEAFNLCGVSLKKVEIQYLVREKSLPAGGTKKVTVDPQQMSKLMAYIKAANDGVSFNDIRSKFPGVKPGALKAMLDTENVVLMNGKYYYKSNIEDFDETADIILATLQSQFQRNAGYTSAKMLYDELHVRLEDFFFDNGGFDSLVELYDLTRHLFEKVKYKGNSYIFAENKHIWEKEPEYTKSYLGILSNWAKQQNNIMTRDEMIEKLIAMGSTSPSATFSYLMLNENQNPAEKTFLMYDEYRYVLTDACHIDDSFIASLRMSLEELLEGDDYLAFDEIDDFFYTTLPELPSGVIWSVHMIKSILAFFDVGFFTVAVGGENDIKVPDAAIVRKNSMYKSFSDILWSEINRDYDLPREFSAEDFRQILLRKGFIHEREKMYSVHTTVEGDLRYFWTDNNGKVTVSKK